MDWNDFRNAFNNAKRTMTICDSHTSDMAKMIVGRLRKSDTSAYVLCDLKKELQSWNMHTKSWKED